MKVEVVTPEEYMGDIIGDLNLVVARCRAWKMRGNARVVNAMCRSRTCLVTQHTAFDVPGPRKYSPCSLITMNRFHRTWLTKSWPKWPNKQLTKTGG